MITDRTGRHELLLPINHDYNKICDVLSFFKLKDKIFREFFACNERKENSDHKCPPTNA